MLEYWNTGMAGYWDDGVVVSWGPSFVLFQRGGDGGEEFELHELLVSTLVEPDADEAELVAVLEPGSDLLDGGLLQVVRKRSLTG